MDIDLKNKLFNIVELYQIKNDPSHDFQHILRVVNLAIEIGKTVNADMDILIPAALFHDIIIHPKDSYKNKNASIESSKFAGKILNKIKEYPKDKIKNVEVCIAECSFSKGIKPKILESKILQDADRLEATGAISIMRTFASIGIMNKPLYSKEDPLCLKGFVKFRSGIDFFYERLLKVDKTMHTDLAKKISKERTEFIKFFLKQLKIELQESKIV